MRMSPRRKFGFIDSLVTTVTRCRSQLPITKTRIEMTRTARHTEVILLKQVVELGHKSPDC